VLRGLPRLSAISIKWDFEHAVTQIKTFCDIFVNAAQQNYIIVSRSKKKCHCEPALRLVWQSPMASGYLCVTFLSCLGDSHASVRTGSE